jgi:hypothetical protein
MKEMTREDFIREKILPNEDDKTIIGWYEGTTGFDDDFVEEKAKQMDIKLLEDEDENENKGYGLSFFCSGFSIGFSLGIFIASLFFFDII